MQTASIFSSSHSRSFADAARGLPGAICVCALAAFVHVNAQAQSVYRIVGSDGRVTFSDTPAATTGKLTPMDAKTQASGTSGATLPYELRQVVNKYPVTLYTSKECSPCDSGRNLLSERGAPFTEKTISSADDADAFQRLSGGSSMPFLTVGGQQIKGYSESEWSQYLSAAGYPESNTLPSGFRNPPPSPLVAVQSSAPPSRTGNVPEKSAKPLPAATPRVNQDNPAGIQF